MTCMLQVVCMRCFFLLAMALTGLTWSFGWYRTGFYKVFGVEVQQEGGAHGGVTRRGGKAATNPERMFLILRPMFVGNKFMNN